MIRMLCGTVFSGWCVTSFLFVVSRAQLENIALNKPAGTNGNHSTYPPSGAVDGYTSSRTCAIVSAPRGVPAEWWVDLEESYRVQRIRIYNTYGYFGTPARFNNFVLSVGESLSDRTDCGPMFVSNPPLPRVSSVNISCDQVGQFVHLRRVNGTDTPESIKYLTLCEVEVYGTIQFSCTNCPSESACDVDVGCSQCAPGKLRPECIEDCEDGKYGTDCLESCGRCADSAPCQKDNGFCSLCETWWTDNWCKTEIETPVVNDETASAASITNNRATIAWEPLRSVPQHLADFYSYKAKYRQGSGSYTEGPYVNHSGSTSAYTFESLTHNTNYEFAVNTYRVRGSASTPGGVYSPVTGKTRCNSPGTPQITAITAQNGTESTLGPILVTYMDLTALDSGCDRISSAQMQHRSVGLTNYITQVIDILETISAIQPITSGEYQVRLVVTNNQGLSASSLTHSVGVQETRLEYKTTTLPITPASPTAELNVDDGQDSEGKLSDSVVIVVAVVVVVVGVVVIVIVVTFLLLKHRRQVARDAVRKDDGNTRTPETTYVNQGVAVAERPTNVLSAPLPDTPQYESIGLEHSPQSDDKNYTQLQSKGGMNDGKGDAEYQEI